MTDGQIVQRAAKFIRACAKELTWLHYREADERLADEVDAWKRGCIDPASPMYSACGWALVARTEGERLARAGDRKAAGLWWDAANALVEALAVAKNIR